MKCSNNHRDWELLIGLLLKYVSYAFMIIGNYYHAVLFRQSHDKDDKSD